MFQRCLRKLLSHSSQYHIQMEDGHMLRVTGVKKNKSISLINLAHLATLPSLTWINEMACSFNSACLLWFQSGFADLNPQRSNILAQTLVKFNLCDGAEGSSKWHSRSLLNEHFVPEEQEWLFSDQLVTPSHPELFDLIHTFVIPSFESQLLSPGLLLPHMQARGVSVSLLIISTCVFIFSWFCPSGNQTRDIDVPDNLDGSCV